MFSAHAPDLPKNSIAPQCCFALLCREEQFVNPRVERTGSHAISRRPEAGRLEHCTAGPSYSAALQGNTDLESVFSQIGWGEVTCATRPRNR